MVVTCALRSSASKYAVAVDVVVVDDVDDFTCARTGENHREVVLFAGQVECCKVELLFLPLKIAVVFGRDIERLDHGQRDLRVLLQQLRAERVDWPIEPEGLALPRDANRGVLQNGEHLGIGRGTAGFARPAAGKDQREQNEGASLGHAELARRLL